MRFISINLHLHRNKLTCRSFISGCLFIVLAIIFPDELLASSAIRVFDDGGNQISLDRPAKRIISLSPHITELLFAAGAGSKVIATVAGSDYPQAALKIKRIGQAGRLDYESILVLQPDLIVGWLSGNRHENITRLKKLGFKVFLSEPKKLEDIARNIKVLGKLAGTSKWAEPVAISFLNKLHKLKLKYQNKKPVNVFYLLWHKPILTINSEHIISNVIKLCGGVNIFASQPVYTPIVDFESVLGSNPDAIISASKGNKKPAWLESWRQKKGLEAIKNNSILLLEPDWIHRQTPRILLAADKMCKFLDGVRKSN